jgi:hypothetical protein
LEVLFVLLHFFGADGLPLYVLVLVGPPAGWTQAVHCRLNVVVAELAYLYIVSIDQITMGWARLSHLVAAGTGLEELVVEVQLLHAEWANFFLFILVDELVLL